jgi:hypothetical protein
MKITRVAKMYPIGDEFIEPVTIEISQDVPPLPDDHSKTYEVMGKFYDSEAQKIYEALKAGLPGGTYTRLMSIMFADYASNCYFRVGSDT